MNTLQKDLSHLRPSNAFVGASWTSLVIGILAYLVGLWNTPAMALNEKGYYLAVLLLSLFAVVTVQKNVRDLTYFRASSLSAASGDAVKE